MKISKECKHCKRQFFDTPRRMERRIYCSKGCLNRGKARPLSTPEARFFAKIERASSGCWQWVGSISGDGYAQIYVSKAQGGRGGNEYAHRLSFELHKGTIPHGMVIDHTCCNRSCVNPDHLEAVSNQENVKRGFQRLAGTGYSHSRALGERNHGAKLTEADVLDIRASRGVSINELARRYGVSRGTIGRVVHGHTWAHLTPGWKPSELVQ